MASIAPRSSTEKYAQQRLAAVRAAAAVFADKGYHGACTRDIAERMGIKQGSLYYYFKSKEDALVDVCLYGMHDYAERMNAIAASDQPFEAKLAACVTSHITKYREKNEALHVYNAERLYLPEAKRSKLYELGSGYRQQLESIFVAAVGKRCHPRDDRLSIRVACSYRHVQRLGRLYRSQPGRRPSEIIENCVELLLNGFIGKN